MSGLPDRLQGYSFNNEVPFDHVIAELKRASGVNVEALTKHMEKISGLPAKTVQTAFMGDAFSIGGNAVEPMYKKVKPITEYLPNKDSRLYA